MKEKKEVITFPLRCILRNRILILIPQQFISNPKFTNITLHITWGKMVFLKGGGGENGFLYDNINTPMFCLVKEMSNHVINTLFCVSVWKKKLGQRGMRFKKLSGLLGRCTIQK